MIWCVFKAVKENGEDVKEKVPFDNKILENLRKMGYKNINIIYTFE